MAFSTVIHFGRDDAQHVKALRHAGYKVRESKSLNRLLIDLQDENELNAVIVSEAEPRRAEQAAVLVRHFSGAPLILFRPSHVAIDESRFDRVYSSPVPAANWLFDIAVLVMQNKELRADSERLLKQEQAVRAKTRRQWAPANA